jgi:hypothetical protein
MFHLSPEQCAAFLDPLIESWDMDLMSFGVVVRLNQRVVPGGAGGVVRFESVERRGDTAGVEPGRRRSWPTPR